MTARAHWRSRATIAVGCVAVLAAGGGFFLFGRGSGTGSSHAAALTLPGCTTAVAKAPQLHQLASQMSGLGGQPFDVATRPGFAFVSFTNGRLAVMSTAKSPASTLLTVQVPLGSLGETLTPDQGHLVVSGSSGLTVYQVSALEQGGTATPLGSLSSPGQKHAAEVAVTPDGRFAFVTYQTAHHVGGVQPPACAQFRLQPGRPGRADPGPPGADRDRAVPGRPLRLRDQRRPGGLLGRRGAEHRRCAHRRGGPGEGRGQEGGGRLAGRPG